MIPFNLNPDPAPITFPIPDTERPVAALHELLAGLGVTGVTRVDDKTYATFSQKPSLSVAKKILARVRRPR